MVYGDKGESVSCEGMVYGCEGESVSCDGMGDADGDVIVGEGGRGVPSMTVEVDEADEDGLIDSESITVTGLGVLGRVVPGLGVRGEMVIHDSWLSVDPRLGVGGGPVIDESWL